MSSPKSAGGSKNVIPAFPGLGPSATRKPAPPKYLEVKTASGQTELREVKLLQRERDRQANEPPRLTPHDPKTQGSLTPTTYSSVSKAYDFPAHKYGVRVDSRTEAKRDFGHGLAPPIDYAGSAFRPPPNAPPKMPTVPRPYVPPAPEAFSGVGKLGNRSVDGRILGDPPRRFADERNVPYREPDEPVGPNNPAKELNDTWSAYWDDSAAAVYYFNKVTGEATWVPPRL